MARKIETRDVVAAEWTDQDGTVVRGRIVSRTKTSAKVEWREGKRHELVYFGDSTLRFLTADEL